MPAAVIVGAGIGGLSAAIGLRRIGWQVTVLERAGQFAPVGAGITLWPNAVRALAALGVHVDAPAIEPGGIRTSRGRWLTRWDPAQLRHRPRRPPRRRCPRHAPNLGQGGGMAIEDAVVLADALIRTSDIPGALAQYNAQRRPRTTAVAREAALLARTMIITNGAVIPLRNAVARAMPTSGVLRSIAKWADWTPPQLLTTT